MLLDTREALAKVSKVQTICSECGISIPVMSVGFGCLTQEGCVSVFEVNIFFSGDRCQ